MNNDLTTYDHTQKGPWGVVLYSVAAALLTGAWCASAVPALAVILCVSGGFVFLLGASMHWLRVFDDGNRLVVRFGPFPLFRRAVWYDDIVEVEPGRTSFLDGWGIHLSLRGGWVWNVWGFHCVVLRLERGIFTIGTDDAERLAAFLLTKMADKRPRG